MSSESKEHDVPLLETNGTANDRSITDNHDESKDIEAQPLPSRKSEAPGLGRSFLIWTAINMLATIGIVFTNKAIFSDPAWKHMQTSFASFHFLCTGLTLWVVSRPAIGAFVPKRTTILEIMPLALAMCFNVVLPNFSLAYCTVAVYQLVRVLLTPVTAIVNYVLYRSTIPRAAALVLIPVCVGVGITSYYDVKPDPNAKVQTTSTLGLLFALLGILASAVYTVLIGSFHKKLQMSSSQLLFNQAPVASVMLMFAIPIVDQHPVVAEVPVYRWGMILLSGAFASLINISQFFIVNASGPVASTVVGHLKTVSIVGIGWVLSGRGFNKGLWGVFMTIAGIVWYTYIMINRPKA